MQVNVKLLNQKAKLPTKATDGANGFDMYCTEVTEKNGYLECKTGVSLTVPPGHVGLLVPRSSLSNYEFVLANSCGILDMDFTGEISFRFRNLGNKTMFLKESYPNFYGPGDRVGQLLIIPNPEISLVQVTDLETTIRGSGGYGSTNK